MMHKTGNTLCGISLAIAVLIISAGCVKPGADQKYAEASSYKEPPYTRQATFDMNQYVPYAQPGTASISGEAFLKTRGGDVRYAAGESVLLLPGTAYAREFLEQDIIRDRKEISPPASKEIYRLIKQTTADSRGRFTFSELPAGDYLLYTSVYWAIPGRSSGSGGPIVQDVSVSPNEQKTVILTK